MQATDRFTELVQRPDDAIPLDEAALLIAAHDHPVEVATELAALDGLAAAVPPGSDGAGLARHLFRDLGYAGNSVDYGDPRNSYLDVVRVRRLGIPITLSVLMLEVGRRIGLDLHGVGMPGHFLVGDGREVFYDPFHEGAVLDAAGCRELFAAARGAAAPFRPEYLAPVPTTAILSRMLANLVHAFLQRDPPAAVWALRLRVRVPGLPARERRQAAGLLGTLGRFAEAATLLDSIAAESDDEDARRAERDAAYLRSRAN
ncbi:MAG TPA: transglutaminase-like domain-containing protein [Acidimicrobiia bacterium]|nr:transglutaminase-like domain-containing protein [Acidimicrobiia bacterium]